MDVKLHCHFQPKPSHVNNMPTSAGAKQRNLKPQRNHNFHEFSFDRVEQVELDWAAKDSATRLGTCQATEQASDITVALHSGRLVSATSPHDWCAL